MNLLNDFHISQGTMSYGNTYIAYIYMILSGVVISSQELDHQLLITISRCFCGYGITVLMIIVPYLCGHGAHFYSRQTPPHVSSYEGNQSHCTWDNTMSTHTGRTTWTIVWHLRIATIPGEFVRLASCRRLGISVGRLWLPLDRWDLKL